MTFVSHGIHGAAVYGLIGGVFGFESGWIPVAGFVTGAAPDTLDWVGARGREWGSGAVRRLGWERVANVLAKVEDSKVNRFGFWERWSFYNRAHFGGGAWRWGSWALIAPGLHTRFWDLFAHGPFLPVPAGEGWLTERGVLPGWMGRFTRREVIWAMGESLLLAVSALIFAVTP